MAYINQYLLADPRLYKELELQLREIILSKKIGLDGNRIKKITYASWQQKHYYWPDQVFHGHWQNFEKRKEENGLWSLALLGQSARYHFDNDLRRLAIQSSKFDSWQTWISKQSGLPVIAWHLNQVLDEFTIDNDAELENALKSTLGFRAIVSPHHPLIEDYIDNVGLHETHMHLNGTTLLEQLWHHALQHPELIYERLLEEYSNERVSLLYASNSHLSEPKDFFDLLILARHLREVLLTWLTDENETSIVKKRLNHFLNKKDQQKYFANETVQFKNARHWNHIDELHWQVKIQNKLRSNKSSFFDCCYLLYILSMNCYQRLLVQGSDQYGFDQFQKFADDGVREEIETEYKSRFYQLHGSNPLGNPDLATLEARFAPKKSTTKNETLIKNILVGFLEYSKGENKLYQSLDIEELSKEALTVKRPTLRLIAHFIKRKWSPINGSYYYQELRESLVQSGSKLIELLESNKSLRQIVTGVDAAANELEAPPEVFASFYRYCRQNDLRNFTYHVGEDFEHLVSGIRSVFDAINFLELKNGDRLGHATAIGICPSLWLESMPERVFIKRSEWLDNLLFIRKVALSAKEIDFPIIKLEEEILKILEELDLEPSITLAQLAFDMRGLNPEVVEHYLKGNTSHFTGWLKKEVKLVQESSNTSLHFIRKRWFDYNCLVKGETLIEVELSDTSVRLMIQLQQYVQKIICNKHIVVETLPTSNVRISHYKSIDEHHIFRWLGLEGRFYDGDSKMLLILGSDDPGIFATDMRNEIYHIFSTLRHKFGLDPHTALNYIKTLNENGRIYRFDYADEFVSERKNGYAIVT